jgi:hypothetical protein
MRRFRLRQDRLPKGMAYPLRRCALDAMFEVGDINVVRHVTFHTWPGRPHFEALFFGISRRSPSAGGCEIHINAVSRRDLKKIETLLQVEGIPNFLRWLQTTSQAAVSKPRDLFHWNAWISKGALKITHDYHAAP